MRKFALPAVVVLLATLVPATPAAAIDEVNTKRLRDAVTVNGILSHQRVLQRIANTNGGTRASGTPGYAASAVKAANAADAGYHAVIIFNEGQPGRQEFFTGTLGGPGELPVVGLSFAGGQALYLQTRSADVVVRVVTSTEVTEDAPTSNVLADTPGGDPDKVIVVGAHLDSVVEGPGINDNGSGTAAILEIAVQMSKLGINPRQKVRFAFWGAGERPAGFRALRREPQQRQPGQDLRQPELRHGGFAELRTAAPRVSRTTRATTRPATTSTTSAPGR